LEARSWRSVSVAGKVSVDVDGVDPPLTFDFVGRNPLLAEHVPDRSLADRRYSANALGLKKGRSSRLATWTAVTSTILAHLPASGRGQRLGA
jgi:hypothetical protein